MKNRLYILGAASALMMLHGCNFLKEESQSEMIPRTTEDFSELLIGSGYPDNYGPDISILEYLDDDCALMLNYSNSMTDWNTGEVTVFPPDFYAGDQQAVTYAPYYQWQPEMCDYNGYQERINDDVSQTMYYQFYQKIKGCNAVLDLIDSAIGPDDQRDRVKAEALAIRAMLYFQLVNIYGEPYNYNKEAPGVPLKLDANLSDEPIARATVAQVYEDVIVPDLEEAARLMDPLEYIEHNYRINQPSIHILLSRVYLYMDRYEDCIAEAEKAMDYGIRVMNLITEYDPNNLPYPYNCLDYNNPEVLWIFGSSTRAENIAYKSGLNPAFQALWDPDNDVRYTMFKLKAESWDTNNSNFIITKPYGSSTLGQCIRTSEAVLNRMEAMALLGQDSEALSELNSFRATRIRNYADVSLSGEALLTEIRTERRKELCYEGHRWFDLRRQGMPEIRHEYRDAQGAPSVIYTLAHNDPMYTLPIPSSLLEQNRALEQNECRNMGARQGEQVIE